MIVTSDSQQHSFNLEHNGLATSRLRRAGMTILHNPRHGMVGNGVRAVWLGTESVWYQVLTVKERYDLCLGLSQLLGLLPPDMGLLSDDRGEIIDIVYDSSRGGWRATAREVS